ncbi:MAG: ceramidase, partial [Moraxellaceae bacterium]|nr:ceramidase [Moraxellaceae bacterium]
PVAIFAQGTAGDVSPHYHGPGDVVRRRRISGDAEYAYAVQNGRYQSNHALGLLAPEKEEAVSGGIDAILTYVDFTAIRAEPRFADGNAEAWTSAPCHGVAFARGTRVDGPGMPALLGLGAAALAAALKRKRLDGQGASAHEQAYYRRLYAAQGNKDILIEAGRKLILGRPLDRIPVPGMADPLVKELKRQVRAGALQESPFVPTVLPLQIVVLGGLALVCCPGEFTTTAGARLVATVQEALRGRGIRQVLICTYCNDYMGYVTTQQEYQEQCYEGGHTLFGQWTLAAFQTRFAALAAELLRWPRNCSSPRTGVPMTPSPGLRRCRPGNSRGAASECARAALSRSEPLVPVPYPAGRPPFRNRGPVYAAAPAVCASACPPGVACDSGPLRRAGPWPSCTARNFPYPDSGPGPPGGTGFTRMEVGK